MQDKKNLIAKYNLSLTEIQKEFDLSPIEGDLELRDICRAMTDRIDGVLKIIEPFFQPDVSMPSIREISFFSEREKTGIFSIYAKLMYMVREHAELEVRNDETLFAEFIKKNMAKWKELKPQILNFIIQIKESWEKDNDLQQIAGYLG